MKDMTFQVEEDGLIKEYNIIKYVKNPNNNKSYILYSDNNNDEVYASVYRIDKGELVLDAVHDEEEWSFLDKTLEDMED